MPLLRCINGAWLAACLLAAPVAAGAGDASPDCSKVPCRAAHTADVRFGEETLRLAVPVSPYLTSDGHIVIFPGDRLVFRFPFTADAPGDPQFVRDETGAAGSGSLKDEPPGTFVLSYGQFAGKDSMTLMLQHNLPATLKLKAFMSVPGPDGPKLLYTTTCPIMPNVVGMENWAQPLGLLILEEFKFQTAASGSMTCD